MPVKITYPNFDMLNESSDRFFQLYEQLRESEKATQKLVERLSNDTAIAVEKLKRHLPPALRLMAYHGWFVFYELDFGTIYYYAEQLENGNEKVVNEALISILDEGLKSYKEMISERFPHRQKAIFAAIDSHERKNYYLSIPVFLAQSEGICKELTNRRFFTVRKSKPSTKKWVSKVNVSLWHKMLLEPLKHDNIVRQDQVLNKPSGINRHDVLHGDSNDYGDSHGNSYKALSLLTYLVGVVYDIKEDLS